MMEGTHKKDLLERWMKKDLIGTLDEGEEIVQQLLNVSCWKAFRRESQLKCQMKYVRGW